MRIMNKAIISISLVAILFLGAIFVVLQYNQYQKGETRSCGGDLSYDVKCSLGTYCQSLDEGSLAGGTCEPYLAPLFDLFNK